MVPGIILFITTALALLLANSSCISTYQNVLEQGVFGLSIHHWINDGLMAIFFFVVGMEIKREIISGELSTTKKAALPLIAALGGMLAPALIYFYFNPSGENARGWGIPMATDIAFAMGVFSLLGKRVPFALKIFLLALAIVDDLGAVLVIALFYTSKIHFTALLAAALVFAAIGILLRLKARSYFLYIALGVLAWYAMLHSGVHATIAGVILGMITPMKEELERKLHHWVAFLIMPLFALANAGVDLRGVQWFDVFGSPVFHGISWGLLLGKPLGIFLACWIAVKAKLAVLPTGVGWMEILGAGFLGGIGFTMALFISGLALSPDHEVFSKTAILSASVLAAMVGAGILCFRRRRSDV